MARGWWRACCPPSLFCVRAQSVCCMSAKLTDGRARTHLCPQVLVKMKDVASTCAPLCFVFHLALACGSSSTRCARRWEGA